MSWQLSVGNPGDHVLTVRSEAGIEAKFKQPRDQGTNKLVEIANELIVYDLARITGLTPAYTSLAYVDGRPGIISVIESNLNWSHIVNNRLQSCVININEFRQLVAFDMWIANSDRSQGRVDHVIVRQLGDRYIALPMDSSHTLNGHRGEIWNLTNVEDESKFPVENYSHVSEGEVQNYFQVETMVITIQALTDAAISNIVDAVTTSVSSSRPAEEVEALRNNSEIVKKLLSFRRIALSGWVRKWCAAKGKGVDVESTKGQVEIG